MKRFLLYVIVFLCIVLITPIKAFTPLENLQQQFKAKVDSWSSSEQSQTENALKVPDEQEFALNNIQMNMSKDEVETKLGKAKRVTSNEYGTQWYTYYSENYKRFIMVSYIKGKVNGLYSNQNVISSKSKIKYNTPKNIVRERLGDPITAKRKGHLSIDVRDNEFDNFKKDNIYTTAFYDKHNDNNLTALLLVSEKMENRLQNQYATPSRNLAKGFELQNLDLVNAERVQHGLNTLDYSTAISDTARKHSTDMAENNYFDHNNPSGDSPFDRLEQDGHDFNAAGENLAYGQPSSIYAHQGLMNSLGHRKNILKDEFSTLGVGVDFNEHKQPYWTENYTG
ncbi:MULTISPECIES: CAP domain-containing protein [Staphylococcus]|uniref:CAP domain-containing protein n=1 Tax=Staphylococcus TaxID=1279 RepID=UPI000D1B05EA|nr:MULTISPECIES: CAP domain-containing protein [Staphylococcus]PTG48336.1 secretion protein [Staphylococcus cohnii]MDQ7110304.1 CAP domain-containing protein [Staphylococcus ureilyticus]MDU9348885.1 CAP domain-containing protein [Staphylococcus ureilyticus]QQV54197.1 CAP domain-containing protein [Staphylococcus sp. 11-B-312]RIL83864.1 CAP domain-containing protein [Staphylococcus cohnii]